MSGDRVTAVRALERAAPWVAALFAGLGLATATGCPAMPSASPHWAWLLHPLLLAAGIGGGLAAARRGAEIEDRRWEVVEDLRLTRGEREYAHKEAERQRRLASVVFLLTPICGGYWLSYLLRQESGSLLTNLLMVTPLPGFLVGLLLGRRWERPPPGS